MKWQRGEQVWRWWGRGGGGERGRRIGGWMRAGIMRVSVEKIAEAELKASLSPSSSVLDDGIIIDDFL